MERINKMNLSDIKAFVAILIWWNDLMDNVCPGKLSMEDAFVLWDEFIQGLQEDAGLSRQDLDNLSELWNLGQFKEF